MAAGNELVVGGPENAENFNTNRAHQHDAPFSFRPTKVFSWKIVVIKFFKKVRLI
jgi:hypothetical protein